MYASPVRSIEAEESLLNSTADLSTPERGLLYAVLRRALFDLVGNQTEDRQTAVEWIFSDADETEVFSFEWVCAHLGIETDAVLERIKKMGPRDDTSAQRWWSQRRMAA